MKASLFQALFLLALIIGIVAPGPARAQLIKLPWENQKGEPPKTPAPIPPASPTQVPPSPPVPPSSTNAGPSAAGRRLNWEDLTSRQLTPSELSAISSPELRLLRNEVFARHGYKFQSPELEQHFSQQPWYQASTSDEDRITEGLSDFEKTNLATIINEEKRRYGNTPKWQDLTTRTLNRDELTSLSAAQLRLLRNEIFARHGYQFNVSELAYYFSQQAWYHPSTSDQDRIVQGLSRFEKANLDAIIAEEKRR